MFCIDDYFVKAHVPYFYFSKEQTSVTEVFVKIFLIVAVEIISIRAGRYL